MWLLKALKIIFLFALHEETQTLIKFYLTNDF